MRMLSDVGRRRVRSDDRPIGVRQTLLLEPPECPSPVSLLDTPLKGKINFHSGKLTLLHSSLPLDPHTPLPVSLPNPIIPFTQPPRPTTLLLIPLTRPSSSMPMAALARDEADNRLVLVLGEVTRLIEEEDEVRRRAEV